MNREIHKLGMSGSRVPALFGVHPYLNDFDVWADITGKGRPDDDPTDTRTDTRKILGQCLEPGILEAYSRITGRKVIPNSKTLRHPTNPIVIGTPDGWEEKERIIIDSKVVSPDQARYWGLEADDIPQHITMQAYWYLLLMDYEVCVIAALVGGWLRFYEIPRDMEAERTMLARVEEWWRRYIVGNERPPFGQSVEAGRWLQRMYPLHHPPIREATGEEVKMLNDYVAVRVAENQIAAERVKYENLIKNAIGDDEGLRWDVNGIFTWRKPKDSEVTDWKPLAKELLDKLDAGARADLTGRYTHTKQNVRRIHLSHPKVAKRAQGITEAA